MDGAKGIVYGVTYDNQNTATEILECVFWCKILFEQSDRVFFSSFFFICIVDFCNSKLDTTVEVTVCDFIQYKDWPRDANH